MSGVVLIHSPVSPVQNCPAVHQDKLLLHSAVELDPGLTLILRPLDGPNSNVLT